MKSSTSQNTPRTCSGWLLMQNSAPVRERFVCAQNWLNRLRRRERRALRRRLRMSLTMLALLIALGGLALPAHAAGAITVASGASGLQTDDKCSLAEAIVNANNGNSTMWSDCAGASTGGNTITLPANATLDYAGALGEFAQTALPTVTSQITIEGNGSTITRNGASQFRILKIDSPGNLTLNRATISGGKFDSQGGGIYVAYGAALTLMNCTVSGNESGSAGANSYWGGGIFSLGALTLDHSTISNNDVNGGLGANWGGGIYSGGTLNITNSTISGNVVVDSGIGLSYGAGLALAGENTVTITSSTITGNVAMGGQPKGGGIDVVSPLVSLTLARTIVSGNSALFGAEIANNGGTITANNTNLFGSDGIYSATAFSEFTPGANDINATIDGTNTPIDSILDTTLANNGGFTKTHNPITGSPAIDKISGDTCQSAPVNGRDQRGRVRAAGSALTCDIGAVEFNAPTNMLLARFATAQSKESIRVNWQTASELQLTGFNVWRQGKQGAWKKINPALIPAKNTGQVTGANYAFADRKVKPARTYRYKLELVTSGKSEWSEIVKAKTR